MTAPSPPGRLGHRRVGLTGPTAQVTAGNVVSRATGLLRVLAIGGALGTTFLGNVYQTANLVSNLLFELLAAGMLSSVLVPPFVALLDADRPDPERRADVERLAGALLGMTLAVMAVVTVAGLVARPWIMRALTVTVPVADVRQAEIRLGSFLLVFFLPQVLLYVVGAVATAVLHSSRRFAAAALAPVANNVAVIATMGAFWAVTHAGGRGAGLQLDLGPKLLLAVGTTVGVVAMTAVPVLAARRAGLRLRPRWDPRHPGLKALGRAGLWGAAALAASQVLLATTLVLANRVEGGVVAFQIAFTMFLFPHALLAHPVLTTLYPRLAADAVERRWAAFAAALGHGARTIVFWTAPATALLVVLGAPALRLIRAGALDPDGARLVAGVLAAYAFGITGYAGIHLLTRASYAAGDLRTPAVVSLGVAVGGSVLMVAGVAAATGDGRVVVLGLAHSAAMVVGAVCLLALVRRRVGEPVPVAVGVARAALGAAVAGGVAAVVRAAVEGALGADSRVAAAVTLAGAGAAGVGAYLATQRLLRAPELHRTRLVPALDGVAVSAPDAPPGPGPTLARPRVVAVVAAKDRADSVGETVAALRGLAGVDEVLVVDDGSTDATSAVAAQAGAWVLRLPVNVGKGGAVAAGIGASSETDVYLLVDADVGVTAGAAEALLEPVLAGQADLAIGILPGAGGKGGFGLVRRLAAAGIERACGYVARSPLSGQRAVRGELLRRLDLAPRFGLETGFTIDAVRAGARVVEVPVAMDHRHTGRRLAGFAHRGRQGVDIGRALWVRLTTARTRVAIVVGALVLALLAIAWSGSRWEPETRPETTAASKVLLVGIPGLGWDDVGRGTMPNLDRLIESGGLAAMSVRTGSTHPALAEGYATLGAGARVKVVNTAVADVASEGFGPVSVPAAADLRRTAGRHLPTRPGDLGEALHAAGRTTAVVGVADIGEGLTGPNVPQGRPARFRPAPLALMDRAGVVDTGQVDTGLLMPDGQGPFGERADPEKVAAATVRALAEADVVLVDTGDMSRAEALAELAPPVFADLKRGFALEDTDDVLGRILADVEPSTLVLVVSVVPPDDEWRLTPVVASGPGVAHGLLSSPSTKRLGLVTLTDIAPTVLAALGEAVPVEMIGHPLRSSTVTPSVDRLARLDRDAAYRERIYFGVAAGFVVAQGVVYALALAVFSGRRRREGGAPADGAERPAGPPADRRARGRWPTPRWPPPAVAATVVRLGVIAFAAFPLATFLLRALPFVPALGPGAVGVLVVLDAAIVALAVRARRHPLSPLAWVMGATVAVLVLDVATGARLQTASILGYSPHTAARFYGLGNSAFAVLAGTTILAATLHIEHAPRRREALVAVAALFALVLAVDGAPSLGDDVGGILTLGPIFVLTLVALSGRRITWRAVAVALVATVAVLAVVAGIDLLRPPEARTHLGRVVSDTLDGHGGLGTTIARKAEANVRVFRASIWAWMVPIVAAFVLGLLVWQLKLDDLLPPRSPRRIGVVAAVGAGVLGCLVNDSGIVVTALVLVFVAPFLTLLALADEPDRGRPVLLEPVLDLTPSPSPAPPTEAR